MSTPSASFALPASSAAPSSSARRQSLRMRGIHVIIPSAMTAAHIPTPNDTVPGHGHPATVPPSPAVTLLSAPGTPGHGHPAATQALFALPSSAYDSPATPTHPRMSARTARRSGLYSASADDADAPVHPFAAGVEEAGLMTPPMEETEESEELSHGDDESGHAATAESSRAGSPLDESDEDAPLFRAA